LNHRDLVVESYRLCIVVTSDSVFRGLKRDALRPLVEKELSKCDGALLHRYIVVPNNASILKETIKQLCEDCDIVVTTGGTGVSSRDITIDVLNELSDLQLPGFGEEFRRRSMSSIGLRAILSRATAFIIRSKCAIFAIPGNPDAFRVFLEIVCPIARHLVYELKR